MDASGALWVAANCILHWPKLPPWYVTSPPHSMATTGVIHGLELSPLPPRHALQPWVDLVPEDKRDR